MRMRRCREIVQTKWQEQMIRQRNQEQRKKVQKEKPKCTESTTMVSKGEKWTTMASTAQLERTLDERETREGWTKGVWRKNRWSRKEESVDEMKEVKYLNPLPNSGSTSSRTPLHWQDSGPDDKTRQGGRARKLFTSAGNPTEPDDFPQPSDGKHAPIQRYTPWG